MSKRSIEKEAYLKTMGIEVWYEREKPVVPAEKMSTPLLSRDPNATDKVFERLRQEVATCEKCSLCQTRKQTVFGVGSTHASLMLVGEAPGANEDEQGLPFVGRAGRLLDSMLQAIQLKREDVYICNVLKCRPPKNRDPSLEEVALCTPYLIEQVEQMKPQLIVALGRIAAHFLLKTDMSLSHLRGRLWHFGPSNIPLIVTFHPAYLLRSPREKRRSWGDLKLVRDYLEKGTLDLQK